MKDSEFWMVAFLVVSAPHWPAELALGFAIAALVGLGIAIWRGK